MVLGLQMNVLAAPASGREPLPYIVTAHLPDAAALLSPADIHIGGWLGRRIMANATNRLLTIDTKPLLAGFQHRPGEQAWIGEHVGKWLHAATLAWAYTGDPRLRAKLDRVVSELLATQEPDGYLGTYPPDKRFGLYPGADWDVWVHKYDLIGLLKYYRYTGNQRALLACRKIADLLTRTFGPGGKSILSAGTHRGMAATSVLKPIVQLYRYTGDERYLAFARYIVKSWDAPDGPKIIHTLLVKKQVDKTANGKAYEMLSNLVGLCELARVTGEPQLLTPVINAWQDIVSKRLYITGGTSQGEHFHGDYYLPNQMSAQVSETCVTTTWIELNLELFRLTGNAEYGNELEKSLYNHLTAAQNPRGDDWCYFTSLDGTKPYDSGITCCHSSGPRALALAPMQAYLKGQDEGVDALLVSTFEPSSVNLALGGETVSVQQISQFPFAGKSELRFSPAHPARFSVRIRVPSWASPLTFTLNREPILALPCSGWAVIPARTWTRGDTLRFEFNLAPRLVPGDHGNQGLAALEWGPFVCAYDAGCNPGLPPASLLAFADTNSFHLRPGHGAAVQLAGNVRSPRFSGTKPAIFLPFADAGADGKRYRVWLPAPGTSFSTNISLLSAGVESRSRKGNVQGSINDGDLDSFVVTFDGRKRAWDWFAVTLDKPETIRRVVFVSGKVFHDGGWFDASAGKPYLQIRPSLDSKWETVGEFADYPATTATSSASLAKGSHPSFAVELPTAMKACAVRVIGKPACGDNPAQAFSSCAELEAFAD